MLVAALEISSSRCKTGARYRLRSGRIPSADLCGALLGLVVCCASSVPFGLPFLVRILRHRPQIVLGVLEIILRRDPVSRQSFGAGQRQIPSMVCFRALSISRLGAGEPGRLISAGGLRPSRRCAGRDFRIWAWRCRCGSKFRNVFHVGPTPLHPLRRTPCDVHSRNLSCCNTVDGRAATGATIKLVGVREVRLGTRSGTQKAGRTNPHRLRLDKSAKR
jgi:hypothetical protein